MTPDQVLIGVGLIVVLAVGSQVVASQLRIPALIIMLPAGFLAGALTHDVSPLRLFGPAFSPLVSLAVAVILYDAGLGLDLSKVPAHARRGVVRRLLLWGVPITWAFGAIFAALLLGMSAGAAIMIGAILVVSGPTVVLPLLRFIRPTEKLQQVLAWEGSLIDPVGGILGAVVYAAVLAQAHKGPLSVLGQFLVSIGVGLAGAAVGTALLWFLLRRIRLGELLDTSVQLAVVIGVAAGCDLVREDSGLVAAVLMGLALANLHAFDIPARRPFFETLVQLIIGVLFVSISATITPASLHRLVWPTLGLVAVLVLITRPLVAFLTTLRSDLTRGERAFTGWMAPRGIVAAATASTFSAGLITRHIGGAAKILPVTFLVIAATVAIYGLTSVPVARRLGVSRPARTRPLLIGGDGWVIDLAQVLTQAGLDVLIWGRTDQQRERIRQAGLHQIAGGELMEAAGTGAEVEGVTMVLLLTSQDDFNALGLTVVSRSMDGGGYRLPPATPSHSAAIGSTSGKTLFTPQLTGPELARRFGAGSRIQALPANGAIPAGHDLLFVLRADGHLAPATSTSTPAVSHGDTMILLTPAPAHPGTSQSRTGQAPAAHPADAPAGADAGRPGISEER
jgi:NhaP-type Na+/H+ or K+/H+ antiporter